MEDAPHQQLHLFLVQRDAVGGTHVIDVLKRSHWGIVGSYLMGQEARMGQARGGCGHSSCCDVPSHWIPLGEWVGGVLEAGKGPEDQSPFLQSGVVTPEPNLSTQGSRPSTFPSSAVAEPRHSGEGQALVCLPTCIQALPAPQPPLARPTPPPCRKPAGSPAA